MSKTIFKPSGTSRPLYGQLEPKIGNAHLLIVDDQGASALLDLSAKVDSVFFENSYIIFVHKESGTTNLESIKKLEAKQLDVEASIPDALLKTQQILSDAKNGLQIYLSGSEGLIGQAIREASNFNYPSSAIQTEHRGSKARRMQCVHCKGITEDVITNPFVCSHCDLNLLVRDHYSRRIAAFQGVCIDAETPGRVPKPVEID
jgi:hypothetical protein